MKKIPKRVRYIPIVKTRQAELKGFGLLSEEVLDDILPLIEFTRSRRSKNNPHGAVSKCVEKIHDILGKRPFVADVTNIESYQNSEVSALLDHTNGFATWVEFVKRHFSRACIPNLHLTQPFHEVIFRQQAAEVLNNFDLVAIRIPTSYQQYVEVVEAFNDICGDLGRLILILDAGYIEPPSIEGPLARLSKMIDMLGEKRPLIIAPVASSFPSSVVSKNYGKDAYGKFSLVEVELSEVLIKRHFEFKLIHGDYSTIHPLAFTGTVTNWVPRVDVPLERELYYHRYRRDDGGYILAAEKAYSDTDHVELNCWAQENLKRAAHGDPIGKSPAHWIAARLNFHISRQVKRLAS